ncbi:MAG: L-2-amino-thiazoline-4-carboxylic acid hydrolase [Candidatus Thorarchaeota archaeon]|nr:MAG: L-2-amino-thiazoline-4-carboxylic acid hydrolase [Candidatus Thorarchaeota archaeon]
MNFVRTGELRPNALEVPIEISPLEEIDRLTLKRLNHLLGFIKERKPEILREFVEELTGELLNQAKEDYAIRDVLDLDDVLSGLPLLQEHVDLTVALLNYCFDVLQLPQGTEWLGKKVSVSTRADLRSFLLPRYNNLMALVDIVGREDAIAFYKRFFTQYLADTRDPDRKIYDSLEDLYEERSRETEEPSAWVVVRGMLSDGKYAFRNDNCLWVDALEDIEDSELKYYICCYGDYEGAKAHNESIVMTMEHTIAEGNPYCSRVLHDTRVDWNLRHPPKEFWDKMGKT